MMLKKWLPDIDYWYKSGVINWIVARDKAYDDIKNALDAGVKEEFEFRTGYYEHIMWYKQ